MLTQAYSVRILSHTHTHTHTRARARAHTHAHTRTHAHAHTHTHTHTRARARARVHTQQNKQQQKLERRYKFPRHKKAKPLSRKDAGEKWHSDCLEPLDTIYVDRKLIAATQKGRMQKEHLSTHTFMDHVVFFLNESDSSNSQAKTNNLLVTLLSLAKYHSVWWNWSCAIVSFAVAFVELLFFCFCFCFLLTDISPI